MEDDWLEVPPGLADGERVVLNPGNIAVFRRGDRYFALLNKCDHGSGPLVDGDIEELAPCLYGSKGPTGPVPLSVACPLHRGAFPGGLKYDLETGESFVSNHTEFYTPAYRVPCFDTFRDHLGRVWVSRTPRPDVDYARGHKLGIQLESNATATEQRSFSDWTVRLIQQTSPDTFTYHLQAPDGWQPTERARVAMAHLIWHVSIRAPAGPVGNDITRDYTPLSTAEDYLQGRLELWMRIYRRGRMTQHIASHVVVGSLVTIGEPEPTASLPPGTTHLGLLAGGTGITPMIQAARHVNANPALTAGLVWSVRNRADAANLQFLLDVLVNECGGRLRIGLTFTREYNAYADDLNKPLDAEDTCMQFYDRLSIGHVLRVVGQPKPATAVFVSGPEAFNLTSLALLAGTGFPRESVFELEW